MAKKKAATPRKKGKYPRPFGKSGKHTYKGHRSTLFWGKKGKDNHDKHRFHDWGAFCRTHGPHVHRITKNKKRLAFYRSYCG